jgi:hypothetical protein
MPFYRDEMQRYHYPANDFQTVAPARYGNSNGFAFAIVAVLTFSRTDELIDWSAFWGGCDQTQRERDCYEWVRQHGNKLGTADARHFFKELPIEQYRL